jgi:hypothetical protein
VITNFEEIISFLEKHIGGEHLSEDIREIAGTICMSSEGQLKLVYGSRLKWVWEDIDGHPVLDINFLR